ncbi:contact-dependent growth inhibition system immunity protein [Pseudomonas atagonensis]|uniref:contact-dependent growth inhibition system immunity protein n=1 Tax=Pseudomonas atagonensis TaxID=2609964 RepID=UPI00140868D6|nr:contact-dependent growth inhibition system immunity protein [Pseudomonas atagonensis]
MNNAFPEAQDFFGAYFHQDWLLEHDTADQVIDDFLRNSDKSVLILVHSELQTLLSKELSEMELREFFLKELNCYYCYWNDWKSGEEWLRHIERKLSVNLAD